LSFGLKSPILFAFIKKRCDIINSIQQLEVTTHRKPTFVIPIKKSERVGFFIKNLNSSFGFFFT
jgi:hypothetical protein